MKAVPLLMWHDFLQSRQAERFDRVQGGPDRNFWPFYGQKNEPAQSNREAVNSRQKYPGRKNPAINNVSGQAVR
jgi:hypothetical protein